MSVPGSLQIILVKSDSIVYSTKHKNTTHMTKTLSAIMYLTFENIMKYLSSYSNVI